MFRRIVLERFGAGFKRVHFKFRLKFRETVLNLLQTRRSRFVPFCIAFEIGFVSGL